MASRTVEKSYHLNRREDVQLRRLISDIQYALDSHVAYSCFIRVLIRMALSHQDEIIAAAEEREGELVNPQAWRRASPAALRRGDRGNTGSRDGR